MAGNVSMLPEKATGAPAGPLQIGGAPPPVPGGGGAAPTAGPAGPNPLELIQLLQMLQGGGGRMGAGKGTPNTNLPV